VAIARWYAIRNEPDWGRLLNPPAHAEYLVSRVLQGDPPSGLNAIAPQSPGDLHAMRTSIGDHWSSQDVCFARQVVRGNWSTSDKLKQRTEGSGRNQSDEFGIAHHSGDGIESIIDRLEAYLRDHHAGKNSLSEHQLHASFMASTTTFVRLTSLLRDVFDIDDIVATPELTAHDVTGWDSLGNVRLFVEVEREFAVRVGAAEISSLKNVGDLADLIEEKIRKKPPPHRSQSTRS
jgi:acyl carrier protein